MAAKPADAELARHAAPPGCLEMLIRTPEIYSRYVESVVGT